MIRAMRTHQEIDQRSLALARRIVDRLDAGSWSGGVERARLVNRRWRAIQDSGVHRAWAALLEQPWPAIRAALLDPSEAGVQLRQNNPFCGILSPQERWAVYREFARHAA